MNIDWENAPEGATHWHEGEWIRWTGHKDMNLWNLDAWDDGCRWTLSAYGFHGTLEDFLADGAIPRPTSTAIPVDQPKQLTQAVFERLPAEYRWAAVECDGKAYAHVRDPADTFMGLWRRYRNYAVFLVGEGFDTNDWQNSLIERETGITVSQTQTAEQEIERLRAEVERLKVGRDRYEILRKLNVVQFQALYTKALQSPIPFDELVDMLGESK